MKKVFTAESAMIAWHVRNLLQQEGVAAEVRNDQLYSVAGEVPTVECWPEVWIHHDLDLQRARRIVDEFRSAPADPDSAWQCPHCGESCDGNFDICWQCQAPRSEDA